MSKINVLPKSVADLIAAGEVVERPASVVKELTENAIDAGASAITVEIKKGGVRYIRVTDNGCGIEKADVPTAFLPHATSKIREADDLNRIFTLGFRGEALPSIAAVAKISLLTRTADDETGAAFTIEGGEAGEPEEAGCPAGTTVVVRDLFYNTPARMKFLKKDVTEGNWAADVLTKTALSHPEIRFTFIRDEKRIFSTPGGGDLFAAVHAVFGREVTEMLLPSEYEYENIRVEGYISKPLGNRPNRSMQYFFVNGRCVRIPAAAPALDRAYKNCIMVGKFPMCFLSITLPAQFTDVNVHPAKTEIRFAEEGKLFEALFYAARSAIAKGDTDRPAVTLSGRKSILETPPEPQQLSFDPPAPAEKKEPAAIPQPEPRPAPVSAPPERSRGNVSIDVIFDEPDESLTKNVLPLHDDSVIKRIAAEGLAPEPAAEEKKKEEPAFGGPVSMPRKPVPAPEKPAKNYAEAFAALSGSAKKTEPARVRVIGEAFKTYIIAEYGDKLLLIDKHAAHERMIFNSLSEGVTGSQMLLSPAIVALSGPEYAAVSENLQVFEEAGYEIEDFGGSSVIVRACPVLLTQEDIPSLIRELAGKLRQGDLCPVPEKLDWIRNSTACRAAVKAGDEMKPAEMQLFAEKLLADESVKYCPHGRPVLYELSRSELEKQFGRLQ
ncbi:MAG: DNA mismatch repair endonuclease MutL [Clostridia bacterium]|nr:DNA mismatch repair endonuclease MutL [Clostridia bacterium]